MAKMLQINSKIYVNETLIRFPISIARKVWHGIGCDVAGLVGLAVDGITDWGLQTFEPIPAQNESIVLKSILITIKID